MADIPTMYKDTDWTKVKGMNGTQIGSNWYNPVLDKYEHKNVTRPKTDGNFTCAMTWPGKGKDQQLLACNANRTKVPRNSVWMHCKFYS